MVQGWIALEIFGFIAEKWCYFFEDGRWHRGPEMPYRFGYHTVVDVFDTKEIMYIGGRDLEAGVETNEVWSYSRVTKVWTRKVNIW